MLIDSHAHLNFQAYAEDLPAVIARCHEAKMKVINVGAAFASSQKAVELTVEQNFYAAVGLHPIHVFDEEFKAAEYQQLIDQNLGKIVAMGETGFDYYHLDEQYKKGAKDLAEVQDRQRQVFLQQIDLAKKNNLAVIAHGRNGKENNAYQDIYQTLKDTGFNRGVVHCFGGNLAEAKQFAALGFYLGFTGIVTFDKTGIVADIARWLPLEQLLIETDAPYLTPVPHRGKRNEPAYVRHVAEKIAEIKGKTTEEIIEITGDNAIKLFNLK